MSVYLIGVYLAGVHLMGVHVIACTGFGSPGVAFLILALSGNLRLMALILPAVALFADTAKMKQD